MMKTTKEMIAVMQAHCEGKQIEFSSNIGKSWREIENPMWDWASIDYRVKKESQYQPFDFTDALYLIGKIVKTKNNDFVSTITGAYLNTIVIGKFNIVYSTFLQEYLFLDDSICGKLK
jgi:hypothetical protein